KPPRTRGWVPRAGPRPVDLVAPGPGLELRQDEISRLRAGTGSLGLQLQSGKTLEADQVLLATGFDGRRPGGLLLDRLVDEFDLPCASCGYPRVDRCLRWHPRIHVTGPLAELEIGPPSRNIAGARRAGDRLMQALSIGERAA
ncbi:MAG: hypothetical protein AAF725_12810, partial [Acidobacteriota bacterium]